MAYPIGLPDSLPHVTHVDVNVAICTETPLAAPGIGEAAAPRSDIYKVPLQIYDMATLAEGIPDPSQISSD